MFSVSNAALEIFLEGTVGRAPPPAASAPGASRRRAARRVSVTDGARAPPTRAILGLPRCRLVRVAWQVGHPGHLWTRACPARLADSETQAEVPILQVQDRILLWYLKGRFSFYEYIIYD